MNNSIHMGRHGGDSIMLNEAKYRDTLEGNLLQSYRCLQLQEKFCLRVWKNLICQQSWTMRCSGLHCGLTAQRLWLHIEQVPVWSPLKMSDICYYLWEHSCLHMMLSTLEHVMFCAVCPRGGWREEEGSDVAWCTRTLLSEFPVGAVGTGQRHRSQDVGAGGAILSS